MFIEYFVWKMKDDASGFFRWKRLGIKWYSFESGCTPWSQSGQERLPHTPEVQYFRRLLPPTAEEQELLKKQPHLIPVGILSSCRLLPSFPSYLPFFLFCIPDRRFLPPLLSRLPVFY
ncbi:UNVERIFIED_CONTAM: hypothetical protein PYX00_008509 [Menopon gallinae]|uniref:Uncharacterized protein n=1 Tax=Menopon gallinae TaxID=328185 RepID=A0AAW2HPP7_9NEOP